MSIESDLITALASVASGKVYPEGAVPEDAVPPLVTYRRTLYEPLMAIEGPYGLIHSEFAIECWAAKTATTNAKAASLTLAIAVRAAVEASAALKTANRFEIPSSGDQYEPEILEIMEPVFYSFWHT